ncbi:MAG: DUF1838 family protein [Pseudomonadota bacterium]
MSNEQDADTRLDRRKFLSAGMVAGGALFGGGALGLAPGTAEAAPGRGKVQFDPRLPEKFRDPEWNRDAYARLLGHMDFKSQKHGWYSGVVHGVRDGEAVRQLMGFEGYSAARLIDNGDGTYQKLLRETVFYKDLETGKVLEEYTNPYTNETVKVVPVYNDPFNHLIRKFYPQPPNYGGLNKEKRPEIPFILPWKVTEENTVTLASDIHLFYPSALQPEKWPRESSGKMNRVSEMFRFIIRREDIEDDSVKSVNYSGSWGRITPWLPWMLMGQEPGHIYYQGTMGGFSSFDMVSPEVMEYGEKHFPKFFAAPDKWEEPSLSSLENYARQQTPAPPRSG